jgi:hypothetical protein
MKLKNFEEFLDYLEVFKSDEKIDLGCWMGFMKERMDFLRF